MQTSIMELVTYLASALNAVTVGFSIMSGGIISWCLPHSMRMKTMRMMHLSEAKVLRSKGHESSASWLVMLHHIVKGRLPVYGKLFIVFGVIIPGYGR